MTSDAVLRGVRVLTLPSVLFASGLAGHVAGDGAVPAVGVLVALFVLTVVGVAPYAGTAMSPARVVALLVGGQGVLHTALQLLGGTGLPASSPTGSQVMPTGSHLMTHTDAATSHGSVMSLMSRGHLVMLLAHLAAAVAVGVWLVAGERALWMLLALTVRPLVDAWGTVRSVARGRVGAVVVRRPRLQPGWGTRYVVRASVWTTGVVTRRGPPGAATHEPYADAAVSTV
jgi:hypothetical protein